MSIEHTFYCDGPDCERHVRSQESSPPTFLEVTDHPAKLHFCGWDCVLRHAAQKEPETLVSGSPDLD
jgi:hypothetical protein